MTRRFIANTDGANRLGLRELLQCYANEQWVAVHMTTERAAESVLDCFKRAVRQELELLDLKRAAGSNQHLIGVY